MSSLGGIEERGDLILARYGEIAESWRTPDKSSPADLR